MFAIEDVDLSIGNVTATYTSDNQVMGKIETPIKMVPCSDLLQGGSYEQSSNNMAFSIENLYKGSFKDKKFICPVELESMDL